MSERDEAPGREPAINLPAGVIALLVVMGAIHALRVYVLTPDQDDLVLLRFAFIPARYDAAAEGVVFPGGGWAELWSPLTYAFLHGDWGHYLMNAVWLAAFGSALARRFGTLRFLLFSAFAAIAGALAFYVFNPHVLAPVIGASGAISGHMAAVARFLFQAGGPLGGGRAAMMPALPLAAALRDRRVVLFLGIWIVTNLVFGLGVVTLAGESSPIAWEAHLGGFAFGLFAFGLFDPVKARPAPPDQAD